MPVVQMAANAPVAAAGGDAAAPAAGGEPANGGFNFGSIMRMILLYQVVGYFFRSPQTAKGPDGVVRPPHTNLWTDGQGFDMRMYVWDSADFDLTTDINPKAGELGSLLWEQRELKYNFDPSNDRAENITLATPLFQHLQANGSLYAHVYFTKRGYSHMPDAKKYNALATSYKNVALNVYKPKPKLVADKNLISGEFADERVKRVEDVAEKNAEPTVYVNFWKPTFTPRLVHDFSPYGYGQIPPELKNHVVIEPTTGGYYPTVYFDYFWLLTDKHIQINDTVKELGLELVYSPISMMKWRMELQMEESWRMQESWGQTSGGDSDMLKRLLIESNPYLLAVTMCVSVLHMVFDFLAFKNDIAFWKDNKSLEGLSVRTIFLNAICQVIIFLYLFDNDTSWMILISSFIGLLIEFWKIKQACEVKIFPRFPFISIADKGTYATSGTAEYDRQAMRYLSWALYPLIIGYSIYSLLYQSHKSWYSWILGSLVGTVYTFGFIMMCPQLYLNYKLKSVAHLPWRMLTYKALNTFIDDLFAFVITMPTLHRLSCFRDDIIFFIFLYQRYIYRTDYTRVNEFGYTLKPEEVAAAALAAGDKAAAAAALANGAAVTTTGTTAAAATATDAAAKPTTPVAAVAAATTDAAASPSAAAPAADGVKQRKQKPRKD